MPKLNYNEGSWGMNSKKDPRWNCSGRSKHLSGFSIPKECKERIKKLTKIFGKQPSDLMYGYIKD